MIPCRKCGNENPDGTRFCEVCGSYVGWGRRQPAARPPPTKAAKAPPPVDQHTDAPPAEEGESEAGEAAAGDRWKVRIIELGRSSRPEPEPLAVTPQAVTQKQPPAPPPPPDGVEAVKPDEQQRPAVPPPRRAPAPPRDRQPRPGEVRCATCGRYNDPSNRFCRCGAPLPVAARPPQPAGRPPPLPSAVPWFRRLLGGGDRQGMAKAARTTYDRGLGLRARWVRATLLLGALGIGVTAIAPWGSGLRGFVGDQVERFRGYETVAVAETTVAPARARRQGFPATFATDGQPSRAWAVGWPGGGRPAPDGPCGQVDTPASGTLEILFAQESRVDQVTVQAGLVRSNPNWSKQARPRTVDLLLSDGTCHRLPLEDKFEPQTFDIEAAAVSGASVLILDAYAQQEGQGNVIALTEIEFGSRR